MSLKDQLQSDLTTAMRQGDERRKAALRLTLANIRNAEVAKNRALSDEEVQAVVAQEVKRRRETVAELQPLPGRGQELEHEQQELALLEAYLPRQLTREEVAERVRAIMGEIEIAGPKNVGMIMQRVMPALKGQADGKVVQDVVREILASAP